MQVKKISVKNKILCYFLAFALSVSGLSFSMATVAEAAVSSASASDTGFCHINYMSQWTDVPATDFSVSASGAHRNHYRFPLQFGYGFSEAGRGKYITGTIYCIINFTTSYSYSFSGEDAHFTMSNFSGVNYSVSYYPISNVHGYVIAVFDHYKLDDLVVGGPGDWAVDAYVNGGQNYGDASMLLSLNNAGNTLAVTSSASDGDLASQIAAGINASSDVDLMISLLSSIRDNTNLLNAVIERLDVTNGTLSLIYQNLIGNGNFSQVLVDAIRTAMDTQSPDISTLETQQAGVENQLEQNEAIESQVYQFHENAMQDVDFNVAFPASVASAAVTIMGWLAVLWGKLGILQFLVSAACLTGLITIVLGVVNRFVWRDSGRGRSGRADKPK